jgi:NAB conserved region 1 (NCD1)
VLFLFLLPSLRAAKSVFLSSTIEKGVVWERDTVCLHREDLLADGFSVLFSFAVVNTSNPTNEAELQLYRVLQRASLLAYYDTLLEMGK